MNAPENEVMAEQYLEGTLPKRYRDLYWPIKRRAFFHVRIIRPLDIQDRNFVLEMLQTIQKIGDRRAEERKT